MTKLILKSEKTADRVETTFNDETMVAHVVHHSFNKAAKASYLLTWDIDLFNMSAREIALQCVKNMTITIRRGFTESKNPDAATWDDVTFDGKEFITVRKSKVQKAIASASILSDTEILAILQDRKVSLESFAAMLDK